MLFTSMKQFILTTITKPPEVMVNKIIRNTNGTSKKLLSQCALLLGFLGSLITFHRNYLSQSVKRRLASNAMQSGSMPEHFAFRRDDFVNIYFSPFFCHFFCLFQKICKPKNKTSMSCKKVFVMMYLLTSRGRGPICQLRRRHSLGVVIDIE